MAPRSATIMVAVVGGFILGCGEDGGEGAAVPRAEFMRGCSERVDGELAPGWRAQSVVAGPLASVYVRLLAGERRRHALWQEKVLAAVEPGASVTVVVPPRERENVSLSYDPQVWSAPSRGAPRLSDGHRSVRLTACRRERPHTQFNGGFIVRWPHCARLTVYAEGKRLDAAIPFGRSCERG